MTGINFILADRPFPPGNSIICSNASRSAASCDDGLTWVLIDERWRGCGANAETSGRSAVRMRIVLRGIVRNCTVKLRGEISGSRDRGGTGLARGAALMIDNLQDLPL